MRIRTRLVAGGAVAALVGLTAPVAFARPPVPVIYGDPDGPVYCPYGFGTGHAHFTNSDGSYGGLSMNPTTHKFTITFEAECSFGTSERDALNQLRQIVPAPVAVPVPVSDDAGHYSMTLTGTATSDSCTYGRNDDGVITGTGPEGDLTGSFTFDRFGPHYYINAVLFSAGERHTATFWWDLSELKASAHPQPVLDAVGALAQPGPGAGIDLGPMAAAARQAVVVDGYAGCAVNDGPITDSDMIGHGGIHDPGDQTAFVFDGAGRVVAAVGDVVRQVG